jgi:uncharacterized protein (TIGR03067 family)
MRCQTLFGLVTLCVVLPAGPSLIAPPAAGDAPRQGPGVQEQRAVESPEVAALQGGWGANSIVLGGSEPMLACDDPYLWRLYFKGNRLSFVYPGDEKWTDEGTFTAAWLKGAGELDFTFTKGKWKEKTAKGLFKFEGDKLWLSVPGKVTYIPNDDNKPGGVGDEIQVKGTFHFQPVVPGDRPTSFAKKDGWSLFVVERMKPARD